MSTPTITEHVNQNGILYFSTTDVDGKTIYSFSPDFEDIWTQDDEDLYGHGEPLQGNYTQIMTVEITSYGFELCNSKGEVVEESEPANKGQLHRLLSKLGYKPTGKADQWAKA